MAGTADRREEYSLLDLIAVLIRYHRVVIAVPAIFFIVAVSLAVLEQPNYTATSTFSPETGENRGAALSGVAAQFGIQLSGMGDASQSIDFYAQLVETDGLLKAAVQTDYVTAEPDGGDSASADLISIWGIDGPTPTMRLRQAIDRLDRQVSVITSRDAGTVTIRTTQRRPELAVAINQRLLELVNEFNLRTMQSQARAEREFAEERRQSAQEQLTAAEDTLQAFLLRNRQYARSPELSFEAARLERRVAFHQQLYTSVAQALEQARIAEVRNTPVITIVERPADTVRRDRRNLLMKAVIAVMLGLIVAVGYAILADYFRRLSDERPREYERLRSRFRGLMHARARWRKNDRDRTSRAVDAPREP